MDNDVNGPLSVNIIQSMAGSSAICQKLCSLTFVMDPSVADENVSSKQSSFDLLVRVSCVLVLLSRHGEEMGVGELGRSMLDTELGLLGMSMSSERR